MEEKRKRGKGERRRRKKKGRRKKTKGKKKTKRKNEKKSDIEKSSVQFQATPSSYYKMAFTTKVVLKITISWQKSQLSC